MTDDAYTIEGVLAWVNRERPDSRWYVGVMRHELPEFVRRFVDDFDEGVITNEDLA